MISTVIAPSREVFPAERVPATRKVREPSMRKLRMPAAWALSMPWLMKSGSVQGLSLCLLKAKARPCGFRGSATAATLALAPGSRSSVSRMGLASSRGLPETSRSLVAQEKRNLAGRRVDRDVLDLRVLQDDLYEAEADGVAHQDGRKLVNLLRPELEVPVGRKLLDEVVT